MSMHTCPGCGEVYDTDYWPEDINDEMHCERCCEEFWEGEEQ